MYLSARLAAQKIEKLSPPCLTPDSGRLTPELRAEDRQKVIRHLENDARHCGAELGAHLRIGPRAVAPLAGQQRVSDRRVPLGPVLAAGVPHGLHGIVVAVKEISRVARALA